MQSSLSEDHYILPQQQNAMFFFAQYRFLLQNPKPKTFICDWHAGWGVDLAQMRSTLETKSEAVPPLIDEGL